MNTLGPNHFAVKIHFREKMLIGGNAQKRLKDLTVEKWLCNSWSIS